MAFTRSIFYQMKGKFGNSILGKAKNGKTRMRAYVDNIPLTTEEQKTGAKGFGGRGELVPYLKDVIDLGFAEKARGVPVNQFMSVNKGEFCTGKRKVSAEEKEVKDTKTQTDYFCIYHYEKLVVAAGSLLKPAVTITVETEERQVTFAQQASLLDGRVSNRTDLVYALLFDTLNRITRVVELKARGESGNTVEALEAEWSMDNLAIYIFARSANGKWSSASTCGYYKIPAES